MKKLSLLALGLVSMSFLLAQTPGTPDPAFGNNGVAYVDFGSDHSNRCYDVEIQPDQHILLGGTTYNSSNDISLARLNPDGSLDNTFGSGGLRQFVFNNSDEYLYDILVQPDGKILGVGHISQSSGVDFIMIRLDEYGNFDNSFSSNGMLTIDFGPAYNAYGKSMVLQDDGKILAVGYVSDLNNDIHCALCRINPNGSIDNSFGSNGFLIMNMLSMFNFTNNVALQGDNILVGGAFYNDGDHFIGLARFNSYGNLDITFGDNGIVIDTITINPTILSTVGDMCIGSGGRIFYGAYFAGSIYSTFSVHCYLPDGSVDVSFGDQGYALALLAQDSYIHALLPQYDGKIVAGGSSISGEFSDFAIARYEANGDIDAGFGPGGNGFYIHNTSNIDMGDGIYSLAMQEDGLIVAAGFSSTEAGYVDFGVSRYYSGLNVGMDETPANAFDLSIYPMPADDRLNISSRTQIGHLRLIDGRGIVVRELFPETETIKVETSRLAEGIYFLELSAAGQTSMKKIVVHHP